MTLLSTFTDLLVDFNNNLDTFFQKKDIYRQKIHHALLGSYMERLNSSFKTGINNSIKLVDYLKVHDAFANHGLTKDTGIHTKVLHASILKNPIQYKNAFDNIAGTHGDKLEIHIENIRQANEAIRGILANAEVLVNAKWQSASVNPTDESPKWLWLTDGLFTYIEKEANYDLQAEIWKIKGEPANPYFKIHQWTNVN